MSLPQAQKRVIALEKEIEHLEKTIKVFQESHEGSLQSIRYSVTLIEIEWGKAERYRAKLEEAMEALAIVRPNLEASKKEVTRQTLLARRREIEAELESMEDSSDG